jgi:hypothetical protein
MRAEGFRRPRRHDHDHELSGKWHKHAADPKLMSEARKRLTDHYDSQYPPNQRKLDAADQLAQLTEEAWMSLIEMAIAFVINPYRGDRDATTIDNFEARGHCVAP